MARRLQVLIVEDRRDDAELVKIALASAASRCFIAPDLRTALVVLEEEEIDVVVYDIGLPDCRDASGIRRLGAVSAAPVVVLSGHTDSLTVEACIAAGACVVLNKSTQGAAVATAVRVAHGATESLAARIRVLLPMCRQENGASASLMAV